MVNSVRVQSRAMLYPTKQIWKIDLSFKTVELISQFLYMKNISVRTLLSPSVGHFQMLFEKTVHACKRYETCLIQRIICHETISESKKFVLRSKHYNY